MKLKSLLGGHPALFGGLAVAGLIGVSVAGVAIAQGRDTDSLEKAPQAASAEHKATTTSSTTTTTSTATTNTTTAPPPPAEPEPAPAPAAAPAPSQGSNPAPAPAPEPEPPPEPPPPAPPQPGPPGLTGQILAAMNADRAANGLGPLGWHGGLAGYAQNWANWMAQNGSLTHQYLSPMFSLGLSTLGENILVGPSGMSAAAMEQAWMNSPGHRTNILNGQFTVAGVGVAVSSDGRIWVAVDFGG